MRTHRIASRTLRSVAAVPARLAVSMVLASSLAVHGQPRIEEYSAKALFLYNFVKFVDWPAEEFKNGEDPIRICTFGESPIERALEDALRGKTFAGRPLEALRITEARQVLNCQILFVSSSEQKRLRSILQARTTGVLTVGEADNFAEAGGMINLKLEDGKIRLEINTDAAGKAQLRLSSKLLSLARIVR